MVTAFNKALVSLRRDDRGLTTVEYVIVLALIAVVSVGAWKVFGENILGYLDASTAEIDEAMMGEE